MKNSPESVNEELTEELTEDPIPIDVQKAGPSPTHPAELTSSPPSPPSLELGAAQVVTPASAPAPAPAPAEGAPLVASQSN